MASCWCAVRRHHQPPLIPAASGAPRLAAVQTALFRGSVKSCGEQPSGSKRVLKNVFTDVPTSAEVKSKDVDAVKFVGMLTKIRF